MNRLESLAERDETPTRGTQSTLDAIVSSPLAPRTPATAGHIKPTLQEMHPSKAQHSTTPNPDSVARQENENTDVDTRHNEHPSDATQQTPSKSGMGSSSFDFRFARPAPQLGPEAQRMMDELREEALRIKVRLAAEREQEKLNEESGTAALGGRKIAQAKGKVGRFSDVHMAEFKRMDSIAGHPSSFRAQPGRIAPAKPSLKRTQSRANLDGREDVEAEQNTQSGRTTPAKPSLKRTQSKAKLDEREDTRTEHSTQKSSGRLENTAPAKRARQHIADDTSSGRPISRDGAYSAKPLPSTSTIARTQSNLQHITTPTQSSLARTATTKQPATQIPSLSRSPSKPNLNETPRTLPKAATMTNILSGIPRSESKGILRSPSKFERVKSILRHPSFSARKPTAIPSLTRSPSRPNLDKALPSAPTTPNGLERSKSVKRVNFTPDTINKNAISVQNSPSPMKQSGIPRSTSKLNFGNKSNPVQASSQEVQYPSITNHSSLLQPPAVEYPSLLSPRPLPQPPRQVLSEIRPPASVPGTFSFRSDHTIDFGASPKGFGSSPGQASLRQVRQSIIPNSMPGSFPVGNKENIENLPSVPHGIANKKRRRADSDDEEEIDADRSPKKHKKNVAEGAMLMAPRIMAEKMGPKSNIPSPAKKKGLSLSRLNLLARPKMRK